MCKVGVVRSACLVLVLALAGWSGCSEKKTPETVSGPQAEQGKVASGAPEAEGKKPEATAPTEEGEKPEEAGSAAAQKTGGEEAKAPDAKTPAEKTVEKIYEEAEDQELGAASPTGGPANQASPADVPTEPSKKPALEDTGVRAKMMAVDRSVVGMIGSPLEDGGGAFGDSHGGGAYMMKDGSAFGSGSLEVTGSGLSAYLDEGDGIAAGPGGGPIGAPGTIAGIPPTPTPGAEQYGGPVENEFKDVSAEPMSTFSIDVDTASYSNVRRFIQSGSLPPADAVRIEELVNYFDYEYPQPTGEDPFAIVTEVSQCPWNEKSRLVLVGLQGKRPPAGELPPSNLVFLLDVSGSMSSSDKLPLVQAGYRLMVQQLRKEDRVAIVTYAGAAGLVLDSTPGDRKEEILAAIDRLSAGGSTAGAEGIMLAYRVARDNFIAKGNNRVILATDGDFNVGISSNEELEKLIEDKRKEGIFLSVLGFGTGNLKDQRMEQLADKGNGNYAYVDGLLEAKKVFMTQLTGTLFTIAKDVKIQIEFNPLKVAKYRLVGYENRMLAREDFLDDKKDAGELGAGHRVTALYEVVPAEEKPKAAEETRYTETKVKESAATSGELMLVKLRYKHPDLDKSIGMEQPALDQNTPLDQTSANFRFAAAVAEFGMLLKDSKFKGSTTFDTVLELARKAKGEDPFGYRAEFIQLVENAQLQVASRPAVVLSDNAHDLLPHNSKINLGEVRALVGGTIDKNALNKYLRARQSAFLKCFVTVGRKNPGLGGRLELKVEINLAGRAAAKVVSDNTGDPAFGICIVGKMGEWSFPKPDGKPVEFRFPLVARRL